MSAPAASSSLLAAWGCMPAVANTPRNDSASSTERWLDVGSIPTQTIRPTPARRAASTADAGSPSSMYRWQWVSTAPVSTVA